MICHDTFLHCFVQSMCPASYKVKENGERHFLRTPWINHRSFHHSLAQVVSNLSCEPSFDFSPGWEWTGMDRRNSPRCLRVSHTAQHSCAAADVVGFIPGMPPQCGRVTPTVSFFSMIEWQLSLLDEPNHVGYIIPIYIYISRWNGLLYIQPCISTLLMVAFFSPPSGPQVEPKRHLSQELQDLFPLACRSHCQLLNSGFATAWACGT